jgi:enoyl-CoA hydratase
LAEVTLEREGHVGIVTLNAPERRNALVPSMAVEFIEACEAVDQDAEVGAVVICGAGEAFCSGAHRALLTEIGQDPSLPSCYDDLSLIYRAFSRLSEVQAPTVAAVRGHAVGAGINMMLAADLRIVADDARIISGFAAIGIHPGGGHFALLGRTGGREISAALGLFGQEISGSEAAVKGLAWQSVPAAEVDARAVEIASKIASDPELARAAATSFRMELGPPAIPWVSAIEAEKGVQMWSLRRRQQRDRAV